MEINKFDDAIAFCQVARYMSEELPDGQWVELKEIIEEYREAYGPWGTWLEDVRDEFTVEVRENYRRWL